MARVGCSCGWVTEDEHETMCWLAWINHEVTTKDGRPHRGFIIDEEIE